MTADRAPWNSKRPFQRQYQVHRCNAKQRNIDWQFTYDTWIEWWGADITSRGASKGKLVMARTGDIGPYSPDNVRKATHGENISEAKVGNTIWLGKKHTKESIAKICATKAKQKEYHV
jgi:hypothetical protein